jgi:hypothetical protein
VQVTYSKYLRTVCVFVFLPMMLLGQRAQEVPLKNWPTAQYWQPNQAEREAAAKNTPQLQFSANATSANALTFVAITPCRLVDTRGAAAGFVGVWPFNGPSIAPAGTATFPVQATSQAQTTAPAPCGAIPAIAAAYSFNVTVVPHAGGAVDYVTLWPYLGTQPFVSTLDDPQGAIVSNAAIVPAGISSEGGSVNVYNAGPATTDVIIDMNGYFTAPTDVNDNTAIGTGSLASNTTGMWNTASGYAALTHNTTGGANTADGYESLQLNTTGSANTAVGYGAMEEATAGSNNTAVGQFALQQTSTGCCNVAVGSSALSFNGTGQQNVAVGQIALSSNTTGSYNVATVRLSTTPPAPAISALGTRLLKVSRAPTATTYT